MGKELGKVFAAALKQLIVALWKLLLLGIHLGAKLVEVLASLISRLTGKMLN